MNNTKLILAAGILLSGAVVGCKPKTPLQKAADKIDDATHDVGQSLEKAKDKANDAVNH